MAILTLTAPVLPDQSQAKLDFLRAPADKSEFPLDLQVVDPQGRRLGMNADTGTLDSEIPGAELFVGEGGAIPANAGGVPMFRKNRVVTSVCWAIGCFWDWARFFGER